MVSIKQKQEIINSLNRYEARKALFQKAILRETNRVLLEEYKKAVIEAEASIRAVILTANDLNVNYKITEGCREDAEALAKEFKLDIGNTRGLVIYTRYEVAADQRVFDEETAPAAS